VSLSKVSNSILKLHKAYSCHQVAEPKAIGKNPPILVNSSSLGQKNPLRILYVDNDVTFLKSSKQILEKKTVLKLILQPLVGIIDEVLPKIFSPLFTTKVQGMGFGLAICKRLVSAHGGKISVDTVLGKGTILTVLLPIEPLLETALICINYTK
jgi:light-regulated signal transduction histidine kinase (bacteriophytochrome)